MEKITAYCGMNCAECAAFIATKNDDQTLREKTALEWSEPDYKCTPEMINCAGCKSDGMLFRYCSECEVRKCALSKGVATCEECSELKTCKIFKDFLVTFGKTMEDAF